MKLFLYLILAHHLQATLRLLQSIRQSQTRPDQKLTLPRHPLTPHLVQIIGF